MDDLQFEVSFAGEKQRFYLPKGTTVAALKDHLSSLFDVTPANQKLVGMPPKCDDAASLGSLTALKQPQKIMLMGTRDTALALMRASEADVDSSIIANDLEDAPAEEEGDGPLSAGRLEMYTDRIRQRVSTYKPKVLHGFRPGHKVLVLDIDYTLIDHRTVVERPSDMMRPYLHAFLQAAYAHYDIVIWSATSMRWIDVKMREMGVSTHQQYKIACFYDHGAMITVEGHGDIKPLPVLWGQFPAHANEHNTIMFDDLRRNFGANPQNGLRIEACRRMPEIRHTDRELLHLSRYLTVIAPMESFATLNHRKWRYFLEGQGYPDAQRDHKPDSAE